MWVDRSVNMLFDESMLSSESEYKIIWSAYSLHFMSSYRLCCIGGAKYAVHGKPDSITTPKTDTIAQFQLTIFTK